MAMDKNLAEKCGNWHFYVPKTVDDLESVMKTIKIGHLEQPVRIWTDYDRFNKTHFWSKTATYWWNHLNQKDDLQSIWEFKDSVTFNGYRTLNNFAPSKKGCCVCVIKLQMQWSLKFLILCLVASFIFAVAGMIYRHAFSQL